MDLNDKKLQLRWWADKKKVRAEYKGLRDACQVGVEAIEWAQGRIQELLEANNRYLERARAAEASVKAAMEAMWPCQNDGGFEREIGPIGCSMGNNCVCAGIYPILKGDRSPAPPPQPHVAGVNADLLKALKGIIEQDDDARAAADIAGATLNGVGLVDLFDHVGHPFGAGQHKQLPLRSNNLEAALIDARSAIARAEAALSPPPAPR